MIEYDDKGYDAGPRTTAEKPERGTGGAQPPPVDLGFGIRRTQVQVRVWVRVPPHYPELPGPGRDMG